MTIVVPEPAFDPGSIDAFHYTGFDVAPSGRARFHYALRSADDEHTFTEELDFSRPLPEDPARREAALRLIRVLYLVAGVSYYKAALPERVVIHEGVAPTGAELAFVERTFRFGLAELLYRNGLDLDLRLSFEVAGGAVPGRAPASALRSGSAGLRPLVPVGGGKDSATTIELVRAAGATPLLFSLNLYEPIRRTAEASGCPLVTTSRRIDPALVELNRQGAINGHVPVTAITSLAGLVEAVLHDRDAVIFSNERSASVPTLWSHGVAVNHQYSKSLDFERDLATVVRDLVGDGLAYFSLLRPLSELAILQIFSRLDRYHPVFTSCNRAFRLDPTTRATTWCGACDKCRFVALGLAPFLAPDQLLAIFGRAVLDDASQLDGFRELLGLTGERPFECVGTIGECQVALHLAAGRDGYRDTVVVRTLAPLVHVSEADVAAVLAPSQDHAVPPPYLAAVLAALRVPV